VVGGSREIPSDESAHPDLERTLVFTLRTAFVQVLQAKAFLVLAQTNLTAYDQALGANVQDYELVRAQSADQSRVWPAEGPARRQRPATLV